MKMLKVTYVDEKVDFFDNIKELNRFNDILSFMYKPSRSVAWIDTRIRMAEVRKFEVWETPEPKEPKKWSDALNDIGVREG